MEPKKVAVLRVTFFFPILIFSQATFTMTCRNDKKVVTEYKNKNQNNMIQANLILRNFMLRTPCLLTKSSASTLSATKKKIPLITCKNKKLDYFLNDVPKKRNQSETIELASKGWQHYKSKGDFFTIHATREPLDTLKDAPEYSTLGLDNLLVKNLDEKHDITKASKIQLNAMKEILNNQHILLAAETGCGKVKSVVYYQINLIK